jgi:hypothetical protein
VGQYWVVANLDAVECLTPTRSLKLRDQASTIASPVNLLPALIATGTGHEADVAADGSPMVGRWAGQRIAFIGDYAADDDLPAEWRAGDLFGRCYDGTLREITTVIDPMSRRLLGVELHDEVTGERGSDLLRGWSRDAVSVAGSIVPLRDVGVGPQGPELLIVDLDLGEFLDPAAFGVEPSLIGTLWAYSGGPAAALAGLLAASNARGGGDLPDEPAVGRWAGHRIAAVTRDTPPDAFATGAHLAGLGVSDAAELYAACREGLLSEVTPQILELALRSSEVALVQTGATTVRVSASSVSRFRDDHAEAKNPDAWVPGGRTRVLACPTDELDTIAVTDLEVATALCERGGLPAASVLRLTAYASTAFNPAWATVTGTARFAGYQELEELRTRILELDLTPSQLLTAASCWRLSLELATRILAHPSADDQTRLMVGRSLYPEVATGDEFVDLARQLRYAVGQRRLELVRAHHVRALLDAGVRASETALALGPDWTGDLDELISTAVGIVRASPAGALG